MDALEHRARELAEAAADRVIRRELASLQALHDRHNRNGRHVRADWERQVREFYRGHVRTIVDVLRVGRLAADRYAADQAARVIAAGPVCGKVIMAARLELMQLAMHGGG